MKRLLSVAVLTALPSLTFAASFSVTITDAAQLAGITAARTAYCATQPMVDADGKPVACPLATDAAYFQARMNDVAASYAAQFDTSGQKKAEFLATLPADKAAAVANALK